MASYTPPVGNDVDFTFTSGYTPPSGDDVDLYFGIVGSVNIDSVSRDTIFDDAVQNGFDRAIIKWHASIDGDYRIELGGTGALTGELLFSGRTLANFTMRHTIDDSIIEAATSYSGTGPYRFNVYVKSSDDIWSPYNS